MRAARRIAWPRPILAGLLLAVVGLLVAAPLAHADVWANVGPASSLAGLKGQWTPSRYDIDEHFTAISAGFLSVDVSGLLPMIAYFFAKETWLFTSWIANLLIELFGFAYSLDLVNGSTATSGAGALAPVSRSIQTIYSTVLGGSWMVLAVSVTGMWAMWKALVQRRYAETAGQLALSLLYIGIAFLFVLQPAQTIGAASHWTNDISGAFLSIAKDGEPSSQGEAKEAGADQLFGLLVAQPWAVLEFGGLDHCVRAGTEGSESESVAVEPLPEAASRRLQAGEVVSSGGKTCIDNLRRYGPHFLRFEPGSKEREEEFEALSGGDSSKLPDADPGKTNGSYKLGPADKPAAAAMEKEGQYQRLLVSVVIFVAELGAFFLLGALSVGIITAQVLLLLLLAFSPVALIAAAIPGRGHQFFKGWLSKLAGFLLRKAAYSLILAILLTVCAAISAATSELGWLFSFGLQCAFFWAVFLQRNTLTEGLVGMVTGPGAPGRDRALDLLGLYYGARVLGGVTRPARRTARGGGRAAFRGGRWFLGRGGGSAAPLRAPGVPIGGVRVHKDVRDAGKGGGGSARTEKTADDARPGDPSGRRPRGNEQRDAAGGEVAEDRKTPDRGADVPDQPGEPADRKARSGRGRKGKAPKTSGPGSAGATVDPAARPAGGRKGAGPRSAPRTPAKTSEDQDAGGMVEGLRDDAERARRARSGEAVPRSGPDQAAEPPAEEKPRPNRGDPDDGKGKR